MLDNPPPDFEFDGTDKAIFRLIEDALAQDGPIANIWKTDRHLERRYLVGLIVAYLMSELDMGNGKVDGTVAAAFELGRIAERQSWQRFITKKQIGRMTKEIK